MSVRKIVIIGPESTGKSTLSEALAKALKTVWVPEYARAYLEQLDRPYNEDDLSAIAIGQLRAEDTAQSQTLDLMVCDTDLNVIKVWSEHKYGHCAPFVLKTIATRKYDLYLLTSIDIPWENDPLREHSSPEMRNYFFNIYKDIVMQSGIPWVEIKGTQDERLLSALNAVKMLNNR